MGGRLPDLSGQIVEVYDHASDGWVIADVVRTAGSSRILVRLQSTGEERVLSAEEENWRIRDDDDLAGSERDPHSRTTKDGPHTPRRGQRAPLASEVVDDQTMAETEALEDDIMEMDGPSLPPGATQGASPAKLRVGITDVPELVVLRPVSDLPVDGQKDSMVQLHADPELHTRIGPEYQAVVPAWTRDPTNADPLLNDAHKEPKLLWAPHFEGVIVDLQKSPLKEEVDRFEELRRRPQRPCGLPGCTLRDKHPGPHVFPEPVGKRHSKAPWRVRALPALSRSGTLLSIPSLGLGRFSQMTLLSGVIALCRFYC